VPDIAELPAALGERTSLTTMTTQLLWKMTPGRLHIFESLLAEFARLGGCSTIRDVRMCDKGQTAE